MTYAADAHAADTYFALKATLYAALTSDPLDYQSANLLADQFAKTVMKFFEERQTKPTSIETD